MQSSGRILEVYKNKPIVYSLGNWMFRQKYFYNGKTVFPDFCNLELAFDWDFTTGNYQFHFFEFNKDSSQLSYLKTEDMESETMSCLTPFKNIKDETYREWYRKNHYHKKKGLPIYYWEDSSFDIACKNNWNKLRNRLISFRSK